MITLEMPAAAAALASALLAPAVTEVGELLTLQLRVARRADELARKFYAATRDTDRRLWLRAECEVFEWVERVG